MSAKLEITTSDFLEFLLIMEGNSALSDAVEDARGFIVDYPKRVSLKSSTYKAFFGECDTLLDAAKHLDLYGAKGVRLLEKCGVAMRECKQINIVAVG